MPSGVVRPEGATTSRSMESSKEGCRRRTSRRRESWRGICFVWGVGEERAWEASVRRAERVALLSEWVRRVVRRVVRVAVRVWVAKRLKRTIY